MYDMFRMFSLGNGRPHRIANGGEGWRVGWERVFDQITALESL